MTCIPHQPTRDNEERTTVPPCPHFGPCGGCQLQNLTYPAQLELKSTRLRTLLDAANLTLPALQLHPSPPLAYRNRIRLTLAEAAGRLRAGYLTRSTSQESGCPTSGFSDVGPNANRQPTNKQQPAFLPITQCPIAAPILWRTAESLLALINQAPTLWLRNPLFQLDQLELFTAADESALQLTLSVRTAAKTFPARLASAFTALCESLRTHAPQLTGAGIAILPAASTQRSRRVELARPGPAWGAAGLTYSVFSQEEAATRSAMSTEVDESVILGAAQNLSRSPSSLPQPTTGNQQPTTFWVPRTAFFQINRFLLPELLALVTSNRTGTLAPHFLRVTAVEIAEPSFTALGSTKLPSVHAVKATTLDFLRTAVVDRDRPDLIVLDPPRTGAGPEVCALLGRIAAPTLIYVSCSPETLPADLATLAVSGYAVARLHLLDLFPQTSHIETVAILTRPERER